MKNGELKNKTKGFVLVELVLALTIFSLTFSTIAFFSIDTFRFTQNNQLKISSNLFVQETINAILLNKNDLWQSIVENTNDGQKSVQYSNNAYSIIDGPTIKDNVTVYFEIENVQRDSNGNIVESGGSLDVGSREINLNVNWTENTNKQNNSSFKFYINNWNVLNYEETTVSDFNDGTLADSLITNNSGGEVELEGYVYADWCQPSLTLTQYDVPGQSVGQSISAITGRIGVGAGLNASGITYTDLSIDDEVPPNVSNLSSFSGEKVNDIFIDSNYAYLATDDNAKEIIILDTSTTPYTEVGYFNTPSSSVDAEAVWVIANVGYMSSGRVLQTFDLSSKVGSRPQLDSYTYSSGSTLTELVVSGNYAYASVAGVAVEMIIVNVANPSNISLSGTADVNGQAAQSLELREDTNRVLLVTNNSSSQREVFIINTSSKTGSRPLISSYDTNGMSPRQIVYIEEDNRLIVGGSGAEEYQVIDVSNETNPTRCGGMNIDSGINAVAAINYPSSDRSYTYVLTNDASNELKIILGGQQSGGGANGIGHVANGIYTSNVIDTGSTNTYYYAIYPNGTIPSGCNLRLQVRVGNTADLSSAPWIGPDGSGSTYFTFNQGNSTPSILNNNRYIQYRVYLDSDTISTPILESITLEYQ